MKPSISLVLNSKEKGSTSRRPGASPINIFEDNDIDKNIVIPEKTEKRKDFIIPFSGYRALEEKDASLMKDETTIEIPPNTFGLILPKSKEELKSKRLNTPHISKLISPEIIARRLEERGLPDAERFKRQLAWAEPDVTPETYDTVPIEGFGAALMKGMGWREGEEIGGSRVGVSNKSKSKTTVTSAKKRIKGQGLGYDPNLKKTLKGDDDLNAPLEYVLSDTLKGTAATTSLIPHSHVKIISGVYEGEYAEYLGVSHNEMIEVRLNESDEIIEIKSSAATPLTEDYFNEDYHFGCLVTNMIVLITGKKVEQGKNYLKKAIVEDFSIDQGIANLRILSTKRLIYDVPVDSFIPICPKYNQRAVILRGEHEGAVGRVVQIMKKPDSDPDDIISKYQVHLDDTLTIVTCKEDELCLLLS